METEKPEKKANILIRGFVFLVLIQMISHLGTKIATVVGLAAVTCLLLNIIGKLKIESSWHRRVLKYFAIAAFIAFPMAQVNQALTIKIAQDEERATKELLLAKKLIEDRKYSEAISKLSPILELKSSQKDEAMNLLEYARNFTSDKEVKKNLLALSKIQFEKLIKGENLPLNSIPNFNNSLNVRYREIAETLKAVFYSIKLEEEKQQKVAAAKQKAMDRRIASIGEPPQQSAWDGSYSEVTHFLKERANDPSSIEIVGCTKVSYATSGAGWLVGCDYRGKNAFGGLVMNSNWFVIKHGVVVKALPGNAYK